MYQTFGRASGFPDSAEQETYNCLTTLLQTGTPLTTCHILAQKQKMLVQNSHKKSLLLHIATLRGYMQKQRIQAIQSGKCMKQYLCHLRTSTLDESDQDSDNSQYQ